MNRARGVNPSDIIVFAGVLIGLLILNIGVAFTVNTVAMVFIVITFDLAALMLITMFFFEKWLAKPDFVTKHGVAFWTNGIREITPELMDRALDCFVKQLPTVTSEVSAEELQEMLGKTGIEWKRRTISMIWGSHHLKGKAGVQIGFRLLVQWKGSVYASAFYHELLHEVNENIRLPRLPTDEARNNFREKDIQHGEADWWRLGDALNEDF